MRHLAWHRRVFTVTMILLSRRRRRAALVVAAGASALLLAACVAVEPHDPAAPPTGAAPAPTGTLSAVPAPGRTIDVTPNGSPDTRGSQIAVVVPDDGEATRTLRAAVRAFAEQNGLLLEEFVAPAGDAGVDGAFADAVAAEPDVVVGLGEGVVDVFAYETAQWLDLQFLLLGAQTAEPTSNVTAVVWNGATSRGSGAPADGELDAGSVTASRAGDAIASGLSSVSEGVTGVVLHLGG